MIDIRQHAAGALGLLVIGTLTVMPTDGVQAGGPEIPTFTDETGTRFNASAELTVGDDSEKDYGVGDFDQDGDDDIAVARRQGLGGANNGSALRNALLMNEDGVLVERTTEFAPDLLTSIRSRDVVVADLDNDGWDDLVFAEGTAVAPTVLLNLGDEEGSWLGFELAPSGTVPAGFSIDAWTVAAGDLTNDGDPFPDLFFGTRIGNDRILVNDGAPKGIWLGFSDGSSRLGGNASTNGVRSATIVDINGDGDQDIIEGVTGSGLVRMLPNNGSGQFTGTAQTIFSGAAYNHGVGHLNGDGTLDFFGVRNSTDQYRENLGPSIGETIMLGGTLTAPNSNGFGAAVEVADINADGTDDFFVCDLDQEFPVDCARRLKIFVNSGVSPYLTDAYPTAVPWTPNGTSDVAILDIEGDGDLDLFVGHCGGHSVFMQDGSPSCPGDSNGDGAVDVTDLVAVITNWGTADPAADLDGSGLVDVGDLVLVIVNWGPC